MQQRPVHPGIKRRTEGGGERDGGVKRPSLQFDEKGRVGLRPLSRGEVLAVPTNYKHFKTKTALIRLASWTSLGGGGRRRVERVLFSYMPAELFAPEQDVASRTSPSRALERRCLAWANLA